MRATVKDVARLAQVSPKTVSNVVNGTSPVSDGIRARVEQAMIALDYVPNLSARALRNGQSGLIAVALPDLSTSYSAEMAHHFVEAATQRRLSVQIEETAISGERELQLISRARAHLIDGLILNTVKLRSISLQPGLTLPPTVFIGEVNQDVADHAWVDNIAASAEITRHLIELGHRRIAAFGVMSPSVATETALLRLKGYRQALREAGITRDAALEIHNDDWSTAGGSAVLTQYLQRHEVPEAIVCFTDSMALGAISALWVLGYRVPDDVSVVGYDNIGDGEYAAPPLTTIDFDKQKYAAVALDLLAERIADLKAPVRRVKLPYRLVRRRSSGPPRH